MRTCTTIGLMTSVLLFATGSSAQPLGVFTDHADVGKSSTIGPGSAIYDPATKTYTIAGGGENMWATADHFHYVWKKVSGDVTLEATIAFVGTNPASGTPVGHRKACLVLRQTLDSDSVYADAAGHGDGLTSLQWRAAKGTVTEEVQSNVVGPKRLRIEKRGSYVSMSIGDPGGPLHPAGGSARVEFTGDFYVGLGVTAHDTGRIETATFSDVSIGTPAPATGKTTIVNTLETISVRSKDRRVAYVVTQPERIEAPNWFPDATNTLYFNNGGKLFKVQAEPPGTPPNPNRLKVPEAVNLDMLTRINNDHGVSPDGQYIYFNSERSGGMQIWRMRPDGSEQEQVTKDDQENWFPHVSPNGLLLVFLTYEKGAGDHPENKEVALRVMDLKTGKIDVLATLFGGQGTINVSSWSPNSQYLAFVSYQVVGQ